MRQGGTIKLLRTASYLLLFVCGSLACWQWQQESNNSNLPTQTASASPRTGHRITQIPQQPIMSLQPSEPLRLIIPKLGIDADIVYVGLTKTGEMASPSSPHAVAWFKGGYLPGSLGNSVMAAHYWHTEGRGAFYNLDKLQRGDEIMVKTAYGTQIFAVMSKESYAGSTDTTEEVFGNSDTSRLNLITCTGPWNHKQQSYQQRLVVFSEFKRETL